MHTKRAPRQGNSRKDHEFTHNDVPGCRQLAGLLDRKPGRVAAHQGLAHRAGDRRRHAGHPAHPLGRRQDRPPSRHRRRAGALGERQAPRGRRLGDLVGGDRHPLCAGRRRRRRQARPADRLAGRAGRGAGRRAGFRRSAGGAGPAQRVLHHHREAIRLRRPGGVDGHRIVRRGPGHRRGRHPAGDEAAHQ